MNTATKTARSNRSEADLAAELDGLRKDFEALAGKIVDNVRKETGGVLRG